MLKLPNLNVKRKFEFVALLMSGTGLIVWFFAGYFIFVKVLHDVIKGIESLFR